MVIYVSALNMKTHATSREKMINASRFTPLTISSDEDIVKGAGHQKRAANRNVWIVGAKNIAGQVFSNELVEGFVIVDRTNDIVAEGPSVVDDVIALEADAFAEAHDIQPMSPPTLAVARRVKQSVEQFFVSLRAGIVDKGVDVIR